ncbi:FHA domain-containing protein [Butyrivibrio sp. M55]|uniref:FHA domain-containing protein n=1 Tax=Butyrivibrio sp. M55 TaxID=1855323 RepID=UPI0008F10B7E|nr:FHA domain-containing protein [Butyrivibrio sp. M55]SFU78934.1 Trypsin-like peptidase domain-containing protein [Butyrivibrio sp. M55]
MSMNKRILKGAITSLMIMTMVAQSNMFVMAKENDEAVEEASLAEIPSDSALTDATFEDGAATGISVTDDATAEDSEDYNPIDDLSQQEGMERAVNGVVQINYVYVTEDNAHHIVKGGPGILIGDAEKGEYVITSLTQMTMSDEEKDKILATFKVSKDDMERERSKFSYDVVIENDVTEPVTLVNSSGNLDMAVFKLSQTLYNRTPMFFLYSEQNDKEAYNDGTVDLTNAFVLGFPDEIVFQKNEAYYSNERVNKTNGQVVNIVKDNNDVQLIEHTVQIGRNSVGGPLVSKEGYLVGMNTLRSEGNYCYSVSSNSIVKVLSGMGIKFDSISIEKLKADAEAKAKEDDYVAAASTAVSIGNSEDIAPALPGWIIPVIIVLGVVIVALIAVVVIYIIKNSKNKKESQNGDISIAGANPQVVVQATTPQQDLFGNTSGDTTVLGAGGGFDNSMTGMNMATPSQRLDGGHLERKKNGESIAISKANFSIGKDDLHCDFCIRDNNTISRQHAIISISAGRVYIEDNHSKNGTYLNDIKLISGQRQELRDGDCLKLSNEEFIYKR